ncbi:cytochrome P450 [Streptomyces sp. NPDC001348]
MRLTTDHQPADLSSADLFDPGFFATGDPHGVWRTMREKAPVHWQQVDGGRGFWSLTRHRDVCRVLQDFRAFSSEHGNLLTVLGRRDQAGGKMLAVTDPPRHTAIKRQINAYFSTAAIQRFEPQVRDLARRVMAPAASGEAFDLAAATAFYPIAFTALLMGIDRSQWARLQRFAYVAIADQDPGVAGDEESARRLERAHAEIFAYFMGEAGRDGSEQREDLTGAVLRARVDDRPLSREERMYNLYSVLLGATVTTSHAANAGVLAFIDNPGEFRRWQEAGCTDTLVEEVLRWSSPANHFLRRALHDVEVEGIRISEGDSVVVWLGSANRDETVFPDPYRFDVRREPNRHVAFGTGAHRCIGAPMARLALKVFFDEVLRNVERFEAAGPVEHLASNFIAGIRRLPVRTVLKTDRARALGALSPLTPP